MCFQTIDAYELTELLSPNVDNSEVERIGEEYLKDQANLEFIDDMVGSADFYRCRIAVTYNYFIL